MEGYTALYRKLRPSRFSEIIGQPHISRILVNALDTGRVGHAYLFSGPRGTGKTTTAKILAKAVNCLNPQGVEPCNECAACVRITKGHSLDVLEIDGASNRGIDEIRDLREKVRLTPAEEKTKVYIIDEVHMLTGEAFNALLKTLEEPPARVIFILATTESHKVPDTILSRCLRLDFRRIPQADIIEYLEGIARDQGVEAESQAIKLMSKMARGGLRDALSIFEQCMAFNQDRISQQDVEAVLGKAGDKVMKELFDCIGTADVAGALVVVEDCIARGSEVGSLFNDILEYIRNLLLLETSGQAEYLIPYSDEIVREMHRHVEQYPRQVLFEMADLVSGYSRQVRWTNQPQIILELAVIKLCEYGIGTEASASDAMEKETARHESAATVDMLQPVVQEAAAEEFADRVPETVSKPEPKSAQEPLQEPEQEPAAKSVLKPEEDSVAEEQASKPEQQAPFEEAQVLHASDAGLSSEQLGQSTGEASLVSIKKDWATILSKVKKQKLSLQAILLEAKPEELAGNRLTIAFGEKFGFHKDAAEQSTNKSCLEAVLKEHFGTPITVKFMLSNNGDDAVENNPRISKAAGGGALAKKQEMVNKAMEIFGGELIPIEDTVMGKGSKNEEGF